jgi:hypothetical protein
MKNVHILPTDKPSRFFNTNKGDYHFREHYAPDTILTCKNHNIYITSDKIIKDCWVLNTLTNQIYFLFGFYGIQPLVKKIILTTDQYLIKEGVKPIDDDFLEWFVKNPSCDKVEIKELLSKFKSE